MANESLGDGSNLNLFLEQINNTPACPPEYFEIERIEDDYEPAYHQYC